MLHRAEGGMEHCFMCCCWNLSLSCRLWQSSSITKRNQIQCVWFKDVQQKRFRELCVSKLQEPQAAVVCWITQWFYETLRVNLKFLLLVCYFIYPRVISSCSWNVWVSLINCTDRNNQTFSQTPLFLTSEKVKPPRARCSSLHFLIKQLISAEIQDRVWVVVETQWNMLQVMWNSWNIKTIQTRGRRRPVSSLLPHPKFNICKLSCRVEFPTVGWFYVFSLKLLESSWVFLPDPIICYAVTSALQHFVSNKVQIIPPSFTEKDD